MSDLKPIDLDEAQARIVQGETYTWPSHPEMADLASAIAILRHLRELAVQSLGSASAATDCALLRDAVLRLTSGGES